MPRVTNMNLIICVRDRRGLRRKVQPPRRTKSSKIEVINSSCYSPRSPTEPGYLLTATDSVICGEEPRTSEDVSQIIDDGNQRVSQVYRTATRSQQQDTSGSSTGRPKRRPNNQGADGQSKFRRSHRQESYVLRRLEEDDIDLPEQEASEPLFTLEDNDYRDVFTALGSLFCKTSYRWLALYKFRIPKKRNMRDHLRPDDREMTEYVTIIKTLVEQREVPRNAVRDERLNELVSIMEGASEIRHINIHVSRKKKPDRRVLGFIAAVNEFCWILGDQRGARETNQLYYKIDALTMEKRRKFQEQEQAKQAALLQAMDKDQAKGKATLPAQERIDGDSARNGWMDGC
ncbi:hypothetical protein BDD12DRAFT_806098 [Trichophaea hybrida]|nr:hypothetical protein BDD12DRAFT_806098 [Trichophaea hybrida]